VQINSAGCNLKKKELHHYLATAYKEYFFNTSVGKGQKYANTEMQVWKN
jgi:hypothetical protein